MKLRYFLPVFFGVLVFCLGMFLGIFFLKKPINDYLYTNIVEPVAQLSSKPIPKFVKKPPLELEVKSALALEIDKEGREKIVFQKEQEKILPIASLTKLMTAVIVLETPEIYHHLKKITISEKIPIENSATYDYLLKIGDTFSKEEALEEMLIYSSNDIALAFAKEMGVSAFVEKMNKKAKELGLKNTHFANPTGLDPENVNIKFNGSNLNFFNYSTAQDLINLSQYILKEHPLIFDISSKEPQKNKLIENGILDITLPEDTTILGGKTGFTYTAGGCILLVFKDKQENTFFNVVLGTEYLAARKEEMQKLINWLR